jgi:hypothetical protein
MQTVHTECPYVRENAQESVLVLLLLFTFRAGIGRFLSLLTCLSTFSPFPHFLHPSLASYTLHSLTPSLPHLYLFPLSHPLTLLSLPSGMLFSEELGIILEVLPSNTARVVQAFAAVSLSCTEIGTTTVEKEVNVLVGEVYTSLLILSVLPSPLPQALPLFLSIIPSSS